MRPVALLVLALALSAPAVSVPAAPANTGLEYSISADRGALYMLDCKFRAIRRYGRGLVNNYRVRDKGPTRGRLPSDNGRCVITKLSGPGVVTLTVIKGKPHVVRAVQAGQPARLTVL